MRPNAPVAYRVAPIDELLRRGRSKIAEQGRESRQLMCMSVLHRRALAGDIFCGSVSMPQYVPNLAFGSIASG
jgi:hypothetical protein